MAPISEEKKKKTPFRWEPDLRDETNKEKMSRKIKENPFVPLAKPNSYTANGTSCSMGCMLTVGALGYGLFSFIRGNVKMQQQMMRARVLAQGCTVLAIICGLGYELYLDSNKPKDKK